jgi:hypothetical protein
MNRTQTPRRMTSVPPLYSVLMHSETLATRNKLVSRIALSGRLCHRVLRTHHCFGEAYCLHLQCLPRKHLHLCTNTHDIIFRTTGFIITTVWRNSNLPCWIFVDSSCLILTQLTVHTLCSDLQVSVTIDPCVFVCNIL